MLSFCDLWEMFCCKHYLGFESSWSTCYLWLTVGAALLLFSPSFLLLGFWASNKTTAAPIGPSRQAQVEECCWGLRAAAGKNSFRSDAYLRQIAEETGSARDLLAVACLSVTWPSFGRPGRFECRCLELKYISRLFPVQNYCRPDCRIPVWSGGWGGSCVMRYSS